MTLRDKLEDLAKGFLFLLGLAAITQYGLDTTRSPLNQYAYQAPRQISLLSFAPRDTVQLFPRLGLQPDHQSYLSRR